MFTSDEPDLERYRRLVEELLKGPIPQGPTFDGARAVIRTEPASDTGFQAMCVLLEGALADPGLEIDDTQVIVPLLRNLARGMVQVQDLL